jgi:hypothetical protein
MPKQLGRRPSGAGLRGLPKRCEDLGWSDLTARPCLTGPALLLPHFVGWRRARSGVRLSSRASVRAGRTGRSSRASVPRFTPALIGLHVRARETAQVSSAATANGAGARRLSPHTRLRPRESSARTTLLRVRLCSGRVPNKEIERSASGRLRKRGAWPPLISKQLGRRPSGAGLHRATETMRRPRVERRHRAPVSHRTGAPSPARRRLAPCAITPWSLFPRVCPRRAHQSAVPRVRAAFHARARRPACSCARNRAGAVGRVGQRPRRQTSVSPHPPVFARVVGAHDASESPSRQRPRAQQRNRAVGVR